ncbi:MAG TPA: SIR2 family protein [Pyrinomonadaceae bacterium]
MPPQTRVFISSTMDDLVSERRAVVMKLKDFNIFQPVNAENLLPTGGTSWETIEGEIQSSDIFVLILGGRYGYIPPEEVAAGTNRSVTHKEYDKAREAGIPILPFLKNQLPKAKNEEELKDAERRDAFRKEVGDWAKGKFFMTFDYFDDLAKKVGEAVVGVLRNLPDKPPPSRVPEPPITDPAELRIPRKLIKEVAAGEVLLIAGAGISLAAGFPSASAMAELLVSEVRRRDDDYKAISSDGHVLEVSDTFEAAFDREELLHVIEQIMTVSEGDQPTDAHRLAVKNFKKILTTNWDCLFEAACEAEQVPYSVAYDDRSLADAADRLHLIKIHGSIAHPQSLVITERDFWEAHRTRSLLWQSALELVQNSPLLVVGSSLRDMHMKQLIFARGKGREGYIVTPRVNPYERLRYEGFNLTPIRTYADIFFRALTDEVQALKP